MSTTTRKTVRPHDVEPPEVGREEARAIFDEQARKLLRISGEDFLRRWDAGENEGDEERVMRLVMLLPLGR